MSNRFYAVCGIVEIDGKILMVRHTYGNAKDRILLPGGFAKENELPDRAIEREILEETGISAKTVSVMATQFKPSQWCMIFVMQYISGTPKSDNYENSEVLLLAPSDAVKRDDITNMSRELLKAYMNNPKSLEKGGYVPQSANVDEYSIYM